MKALITTVIFVFATGCGNSKDDTATACSASSVLGTWTGSINGVLGQDTITFNSDCTGSSTYCDHDFKFTDSRGSSGSTTISVTNSKSIHQCMTNGNHTCTYRFSADGILFFKCEGIEADYHR